MDKDCRVADPLPPSRRRPDPAPAVQVGLPFSVPVVRRVSLVKLAGELARAVAEVGKVVVEGEVSRPTTSGANRTYFVMKDRGVQMSVVVPSNRQAFCRVRNGERVAVTGQMEYQADRGQLQLVASEVVPVGAGAITAMIAETRQRLAVDGLLDRPRKPLPMLPALVGVLCGTEAAVRADIEAVVASRFAGFPVRFVEVVVAGPGAVESICGGLATLQKDNAVDVIVIARGGGDATAMLPFSDEMLCRALAACRVPVVSAIGHDGDRPLSDEIADCRAGTPSIAASMVVPDRLQLQQRCDRALALAAERGIGRALTGARRLESCAWEMAIDHRLERCVHRLERVSVERTVLSCVESAKVRLHDVNWIRGIDPLLARADSALKTAHARIESLSPARVLERGYAVVRIRNGGVVRDADSVRSGEMLEILVAHGSFAAKVDHTTGARPNGAGSSNEVPSSAQPALFRMAEENS
jgi:exodeoxyribonuclease VII large subunit